MPYSTTTPTSTNTNGLRLLVGDLGTSTATEYLRDSAYTFFLGQAPFYCAGALAANSLSAFFMGKGSEKKVGDLLIRRTMAKDYHILALELKTMCAKGIAPYAGGMSKSSKRSFDAETDRVKPSFTRSQMDNRYAINPQQSSST